MKSYLNPVPKSVATSSGIAEWKESSSELSFSPSTSSSSSIPKKAHHQSILKRRWIVPSHLRWSSIGFILGTIVMLIIHFTVAPFNSSSPSSTLTVPSPRPGPMWPAPGVLFSYDLSSADGPLSWGNIKNASGLPLFPKCNIMNNHEQSPVDLPLVSLAPEDIPLNPFYVNYTTHEFAIRARKRNPGFQIEPIEDDAGIDDDIPEAVNPGGILEGLNGRLLAEFHQAHLHWPSEHTVNGSNFALELHLVHETVLYNDSIVDSTLYTEHVVSILFPKSKSGAHNKLLDSFLMDAIGPVSPELIGDADFSALMLDTEDVYYTYSGGLTSPPCTNGVRWYVFVSKSGVNELQIDAMADVLGGQMNNRPTLEKEGRVIDIYAH